MEQIQEQQENVSIQWVDKKKNKFVVKFENIDVPIEMNELYYKNVVKELCN